MTIRRVLVIDDDTPVRLAIAQLLATVGYTVQDFASAGEFLEKGDTASPGCAIIDLRLRGMSGLQLLQVLRDRKSPLRSVVLTANGDIPSAVAAIKNGAVQYLEKPCETALLLKAVDEAFRISESLPAQTSDGFKELVAQLNPNEVELFRLIIAGKSNAQIAEPLDVSKRTVQLRCAKLLEKLKVKSRGELIRKAWAAGIGLQS